MPTKKTSPLSPDAVRDRAYQLWEQNGKPGGRELDYWLEAERELATPAPRRAKAQPKTAAAAKSPAKPRKAPTKRSVAKPAT